MMLSATGNQACYFSCCGQILAWINSIASMLQLGKNCEWFVPVWQNSYSDYSVLVKFTNFLWHRAQQKHASLQFAENLNYIANDKFHPMTGELANIALSSEQEQTCLVHAEAIHGHTKFCRHFTILYVYEMSQVHRLI